MSEINHQEEKEATSSQAEANQEEATKLQDEPTTSTDEAKEADNVSGQLEALQKKYDDLNDSHLRLRAEFDNYRKRTMREKAELILNGGEKAFTAILPVLDDLERALGSMGQATDVQAFGQGVELIYNKFLSILAQNGVKPIDTVDQPLDTDYHEAIAMIPAPTEAQRGRIIDCVQRGYTINNKVLRHAKVVVGQ